MRFIPTSLHGVIDYTAGVTMIAAPWFMGFSEVDVARGVLVFFGTTVVLYSLCTRYELGLFKFLPMTAHLGMDFVFGAILALSPWMFGFAEAVYQPHLFFGLFSMTAALITRKQHAIPRHQRVEAQLY